MPSGSAWQQTPLAVSQSAGQLLQLSPENSLQSLLVSSSVVQTETPANLKEPTTPYTVKLRGAPFNVTEVGASPGQGKERVGVGGVARSFHCLGELGSAEGLS